jgi:hypothetical protein
LVADQDGDGLIANLDNCPTVANADQADADANGIGDACEPRPRVHCVLPRGGNSYTAYFGYDNPMLQRRISVSTRNQLVPGAQNRGQPELQEIGGRVQAFGATFTGSKLTWQLAGSSATATPSSPRCGGIQATRVDFARNVSLYASGSLRLADRVQLPDWSVMVNAGPSTTEIGANALTGDVWSAAPVAVRSNARVSGVMRSSQPPQLQAGAEVLGGTRELARVLESIAWSVQFPTPVPGSVQVEPGQTRQLSPGSYGPASIKGELRLVSGSYYFTSLGLEPGARLRLDQSTGPVLVHVKSGLTYRGAVTTADGAAPNLLIGYFGSDSAFFEAPLQGAVIAPLGTIVLGPVPAGKAFVGTFFGRNLEIRADTSIRYWRLPSLPE